ncbi:hypothetical protein [Siphonobacter sp. SORGH_AS_1065]|uniref:hypothetical protein n=1 Tax=Siphonobacter sp. SORGH_AS_1065 TaxID=3041795 RepID=UPI00277DB778|nr:hypothetical protein [Siphonobacter sp. SORGH_AS_1065]MDQ1085751.1 glycerophosphoryl diester phosphodiesterase [Siphonobacter sp. SORGH_AS_1065]
MKRHWITFLFALGSNLVFAQTNFKFRPAAHSHNDYEQQKPFEKAYSLGFGSIEADVYVQNGELMVAHNREDIKPERTFRKMYLLPLLVNLRQHEGYPYPGHHKVQVLIDLKDAEAIDLLQKMLKDHKMELQKVDFVLSGNMPKPEDFNTYDKILCFDGRRNITYSAENRARVPLISADFKEFSSSGWDGTTPLSTEVENKIKTFVTQAHQNNQKTRIWGTPNTVLAYQTLQRLGLDYIGSDDLDKLAEILN